MENKYKWTVKKHNTFNPSRTRSYASDLRHMQFNVNPFIAKVSGGHEGTSWKQKIVKLLQEVTKKAYSYVKKLILQHSVMSIVKDGTKLLSVKD